MSNQNECIDSTPSKRPFRPVVIVHGLMTGDTSTMEHLAARIVELHPSTKMYVFNRFCGLASLEPLWRQVRKLAVDLLSVCSLHPEGVHVIGYSQGGLIARGMLETYGAEHNVKTFVSLSSPQGGQYGAECFTKLFPEMTARTAYEVFYTRLGQHALSVANYWYDPRHRDLYLKYSIYLAVIDNIKSQNKTLMNISATVINNTITSETNNKTTVEDHVSVSIAAVTAAIGKVAEDHDDNKINNANKITSDSIDSILAKVVTNDDDNDYREFDNNWLTNCNIRKLGLTRLQRFVLIGGPDDGVISPWQSSQFGVLDNTGALVPMRKRQQNDVYSDNDPIGLLQLDTTGRLVEYTVPGVSHHEWHCNERVLRECIIDWLD